jgi:hypothetical protein
MEALIVSEAISFQRMRTKGTAPVFVWSVLRV